MRSFTTTIFLAIAAWGQTGPLRPPPDATVPAIRWQRSLKTCHPDVWASFYKNPHYKSIASGTEPPEQTGCESCHGPGKAHVEARGGKATIVAFSELSAKRVLDNCLTATPKMWAGRNSTLGAHPKRYCMQQLSFDSPICQYESLSSPRSKRTSVMTATLRFARSSTCLPSIG